MPVPTPSDKNNSFSQQFQQLLGFFKNQDARDKVRDANLERLLKEMMVYFKLMEKSFNQNTLTSKIGRESNLNNDKGFLKLVELMTDVSDNTRNLIDKYTKGERLLASEKAEIAKFTDSMQDAMKQSNEQVGISLKELISNFKDMLLNDKLSQSFKVDILRTLKDYSDDDIAMTVELKKLIETTTKSNELTEENLLKISNELDKTMHTYDKDKSATFAPFNKLSNELKDANVSLDDIVTLLTNGQRSKDKTPVQGMGGGGGAGLPTWENMALTYANKAVNFIPNASTLAGRYMAIEASKSKNKYVKGVAPYIPTATNIAGDVLQTYLGYQLTKASVKGFKSLFGLGGKASTLTEGGEALTEGLSIGGKAGGLFGGEAIPIAGQLLALGLSIKDYVSGFKGKTLTEKETGGASKMIEGLTFGIVKQKSAEQFYKNAREERDKGFENLQKFIGDQNKKIFGNQLDLKGLFMQFPIFRWGINLGNEAGKNINNLKANQYTNAINAVKKGITGSSSVRLSELPQYITGGQVVGKLTSEQIKNAKTIYDTGKKMGMSDKDIKVGLATALQESTLHNLNHGDGDSVGLFQQRANWGKATGKNSRTDPAYASQMFFSALKQAKKKNSNLEDESLTNIAATIQRPDARYAGYYAKHEKQADMLLKAFQPSTGGKNLPNVEVQGKSPTVQKLPPVPSVVERKKENVSMQQVLPQPKTFQQDVAQRKLKSDSDLINITNYGVLF